MSRMWQALAVRAAAELAAQAAQDALSFEHEMAKVRALSGLTREQVDRLALDVQRLARTTTLTPLQALRQSCDQLAIKWAAEAEDLRKRGITSFLQGDDDDPEPDACVHGTAFDEPCGDCGEEDGSL